MQQVVSIEDLIGGGSEEVTVPTFTVNRGVNGWAISVAGQHVRDFYIATDVTELTTLLFDLATQYDAAATASRLREAATTGPDFGEQASN